MSETVSQLPQAEFVQRGRRALALLSDAFLRDDDLADDLDAILGAPAGPVGVAGARQRGQRRWSRCTSPTAGSEEVAKLGMAVTRLDRMLERLVSIAEHREWEPPYPDVAAAMARARRVRGQQTRPLADFRADRAHLRRLAMAAADLLARLTDDEEASDDSPA